MTERRLHERHIGTPTAPKDTPDYLREVLEDPSIATSGFRERFTLGREARKYGFEDFNLEEVLSHREALDYAAEELRGEIKPTSTRTVEAELKLQRTGWIGSIVTTELPYPTTGVGENEAEKKGDLERKKAAVDAKRTKLTGLLSMSETDFAPIGAAWERHDQIQFEREGRGTNARKMAEGFGAEATRLDKKHDGLLKSVDTMPIDHKTIVEGMEDPAKGLAKSWERHKKDNKDEYQRRLKELADKAAARSTTGKDRYVGFAGGPAEAEKFLFREFAEGFVDKLDPGKALSDSQLDSLVQVFIDRAVYDDYKNYHRTAEKAKLYGARQVVGKVALRELMDSHKTREPIPEGREYRTAVEIMGSTWRRLQRARQAGRGQGWLMRRKLEAVALGQNFREAYITEKDWPGAVGRTKENIAKGWETTQRRYRGMWAVGAATAEWVRTHGKGRTPGPTPPSPDKTSAVD